ncbi:MAG: hypothetical protein EBT63_03750, partial [Proteobacteria bacterium]|nr:hypothetical protein [Pseudomonadota bacterium]NCA28839.1 hypothetical protein [Pseudomonadota bacterium]
TFLMISSDGDLEKKFPHQREIKNFTQIFFIRFFIRALAFQKYELLSTSNWYLTKLIHLATWEVKKSRVDFSKSKPVGGLKF